MRTLVTAATAALLACTLHMGAHADVFKCNISGKLVYQETSCGDAEVKDGSQWTRDRERERVATQREQKIRNDRDAAVVGAKKTYMEYLRTCREYPCFAHLVQSAAKGLTPTDLRASLGNPDSVQRIGRNDLWYYELTLIDVDADSRERRRRVQITFDLKTDYAEQGFPTKLLSDQVNIY